jgi:hypothetical protein
MKLRRMFYNFCINMFLVFTEETACLLLLIYMTISHLLTNKNYIYDTDVLLFILTTLKQQDTP